MESYALLLLNHKIAQPSGLDPSGGHRRSWVRTSKIYYDWQSFHSRIFSISSSFGKTCCDAMLVANLASTYWVTNSIVPQTLLTHLTQKYFFSVVTGFYSNECTVPRRGKISLLKWIRTHSFLFTYNFSRSICLFCLHRAYRVYYSERK